MSARSSVASSERSSLALRAVSVVVLFVGFYVLALALAAAFLWIPWAESRYTGHVGWSGIACGIAGLWFVFAILPGWSRNKEERPAPLGASAHPRLRKLIAEVATRVGEPPPDIVYLLPDANAFAAREGGFLGLGQKRVVGIGLPLLSTLAEDEVRAVLAHEFGHHRGGDLRLGPFVHRTRLAVARAIARLDGSSFLLHWPFLVYGWLFLRVSRQISREQELAADALAAEAVSADAAGRALSRVESLAPRWDAYFFGEVLPLVIGGRRPPMLEGFERFLANAPWRADVAKLVRRGERRAPREHDTHPPLEQRLIALGVRARDPRVVSRLARERGAGRGSNDLAADRNALGLLDAPSSAEHDALSVLLKKDAPPLVEASWDSIATEGWLPLWRQGLLPSRPVLGQLKVEDIPGALDDASGTWQRLHPAVISLLSPLGARRSVSDTLGVYLTLVCADAGWTIDVPPGGDVVAKKGDRRLEPEVLVRRLAEGSLDEDEFLSVVRTAELADRAGFEVTASARTAPAVGAGDGAARDDMPHAEREGDDDGEDDDSDDPSGDPTTDEPDPR